MKGILLTLLSLVGISLMAQDIVQVSIGSNYANQTYYNLATDNTMSIGNNNWDLAFAQTASFEAGIHVNESVTISFVGPSPTTLVFKAPTNNFDDVIEIEAIGDSLYNNETSWGNGGALNIQKDSLDFADFGWGLYNTSNHAIEGNRVFVIKLRDESFRKFMVQSLISGVYTLKYADLDGSNEQTVTIDKANYEDNKLILFSFLGNKVLNDLPADFDLIFQRYSDLDPSNVGVMVEYTVTGIVAAPGVLSAQANNITDPEEVDFEDYVDSLEQQIDIIGQDWKYFSFESGWVIKDDVSFFVKTAENRLWQIYIYDFEGSSTGTYTIAKWDHGILAGLEDITNDFESVTVVPNPVQQNASFSLVVEAKKESDIHLSLVNSNGQLIKQYNKTIYSGLNAFQIPSTGMNSGVYYLHINSAEGQLVKTISVK